MKASHPNQTQHARPKQPVSSRFYTTYPWAAGALIAILCALALAPQSVRAQDDLPRLVISEIHYKPDIKVQRAEFVEIYNDSGATVDLSNWALDGGIEYFFPPGTTLANRAYLVVAESPDIFEAKFGFEPLGPFTGRLGSDGEDVILRDTQAETVDQVDYFLGFPWPTVGYSPGRSIQLINPDFDNALPGAWRSAAPTPGRSNDVDAPNAAPFVESVVHTPTTPREGEAVVISARVHDPDGVSSVTLLYQLVAPGAYIALQDGAYESNWTALPMRPTDDEETLYQATIPGDLNRHRHLMRYRVSVEDRLGNSVRVPYADDLQPNFAYFVYDDVPTWTGSGNGRPVGRVTFDFGEMRPVATYHFIAKQSDVADAMFMPPSEALAGYQGNDFLWRGTLIYDGVVYDHVGFRARGGIFRYATGKTGWKVNFNLGHRFQARDDYMRPYSTEWDKLNLNSGMMHTNRLYRGEHGMFEAASYRLFNLAGVPAPHTHWVHWRVITDEAEEDADQYEGDFWGLYLAVEQMDSRFLEEHDLPDGNLYKIENYAGEKDNQGATSTPGSGDVEGFIAQYLFGSPSADWWRKNFDLDSYYSYRAVMDAVHHYDVDQGKNYYHFFPPDSSMAQVLPWDVDLTWADTLAGNQTMGADPFLHTVLNKPEFNLDYQNRLREIRDLLFNPEQMNYLLRELSDVIDTPGDGNSMVDADRFRWDHHPIFSTRYVIENRTRAGSFYRSSPTRDFAGMVGLMRTWVEERSDWIDETLLTDTDHPYMSEVSYVGAENWPADALRFRTTGFDDPQGKDTFAAMEWRIAEVTNPEGPVYVPGAPARLEIVPAWESGELSVFQEEWTVPAGVVRPWHTYRVRVRMQDDSGRWGHWSFAYQFIARPPTRPVTTDLRLTEIMYHPDHAGATDGERLEFIELYNAGDSAVELSNFHFTAGIDYRFPPETFLSPGNHLILAREETAFERHHNREVFDTYDMRLDNGGETLTLVDGFDREVLSVTYGDDPPWPVAADGEGYSLVLISSQFDGSSSDHWRLSTAPDGSPGEADPQPVLVNEIVVGAGGGVELHNPYVEWADVSGWYITDDSAQPRKYQLADGALVPPDGYLMVGSADLNAAGVALQPNGGELFLVAARADGQPARYRHGFGYPAIQTGNALIRVRTSDGREHLAATGQPTLGQPNAEPVTGPIVISKILYHPVAGSEYIELLNISDVAVPLFDPAAPARVWQMDGILFPLPAGITLAPGETLRLVPDDPALSCLALPDENGSQITGPYPVPLSNRGQTLRLLRPADGAASYVVDQVAYRADSPWPQAAADDGAVLVREDPAGFGSEPGNWRAEAVTAAAARVSSPHAISVKLCSFTADQDRESRLATVQWVVSNEENVAGYQLLRSLTGDRADAEPIGDALIPLQGTESTNRRYVINDSASAVNTTYWLQAVGEDGSTVEVGFTRLRSDQEEIFLPFVTAR